jgi:hypothetical protein
MFNDRARVSERRDLQAACCQRWLERVRRPAVIGIGAGLHIPTVRAFSHRVVLCHGGSLTRINPREPDAGGMPGIGLAAGALQTLAAIRGSAPVGRRLNTGRYPGPARGR